MTKVVEETVVPPERLVRIIPEKDHKRLQKELLGLKARMRWTHLGDGAKALIASRIEVIEAELGGEK